jgi:hypothetical protein
MGEDAMNDIEAYLNEPYNVLWDCSNPLVCGTCTVSEFKSSEFREKHDLVGACVIQPGSIVCYKQKAIIIYRKRDT